MTPTDQPMSAPTPSAKALNIVRAVLMYSEPEQEEIDTAALAIDALVADAIKEQRELVAKWMMSQAFATGHGETIEDLLKEASWQIDERVAGAREKAIAECIVVAHRVYMRGEAKVSGRIESDICALLDRQK